MVHMYGTYIYIPFFLQAVDGILSTDFYQLSDGMYTAEVSFKIKLQP